MAARARHARRPGRGVELLLTCEHGGNRVPREYRGLFRGREGLLRTHRGYDAGALAVAERLADGLRAPLHAATVSRLVVDLNRSPGHPRLFSEATRGLDERERSRLLRLYYLPYRRAVEAAARARTARGCRVVHISLHSFTPVLRGEVRRADIGLLYDPGRAREVRFCASLSARLAELLPRLRIRRNYPYRGVSDGLVAFLRRRFDPSAYAGVELEINQRIVRSRGDAWTRLPPALAQAIGELVGR